MLIIGYNQTVMTKVLLSKNPLSVRSCSESVVGELIPDMQRYEARKGSPKHYPEGEIKVTDDVSDYP
jgi:hypothetical protein